MVTLKQLAQELNLSISTISKALHNSEEISSETIDRVKTLAKFYKYKPNKTALNLKRSTTKTIGVIIPDILNHFFAKVLLGIEQEATKQGFNIIACLSNESFEKEKSSLELLANGSVDGFILSAAEETQNKNIHKHFVETINQGYPIVMFDRVVENINCDKIIINDFEASLNATQKLLDEGRKHIALVSDIKHLSVGKLRTQGYIEAIKNAKNYKNQPLVLTINNSKNIEEEIENFIKNNKTIDGILAIDNTSGVIALNKILALGRKVPKAVSIIGFSDINILPFTKPKLSTIAQHPLDIGKASVKLMINRLDKKKVTDITTKIVRTELVLRETTL